VRGWFTAAFVAMRRDRVQQAVGDHATVLLRVVASGSGSSGSGAADDEPSAAAGVGEWRRAPPPITLYFSSTFGRALPFYEFPADAELADLREVPLRLAAFFAAICIDVPTPAEAEALRRAAELVAASLSPPGSVAALVETEDLRKARRKERACVCAQRFRDVGRELEEELSEAERAEVRRLTPQSPRALQRAHELALGEGGAALLHGGGDGGGGGGGRGAAPPWRSREFPLAPSPAPAPAPAPARQTLPPHAPQALAIARSAHEAAQA
jgi:hypothetical protein